jgi:hypothetical protein
MAIESEREREGEKSVENKFFFLNEIYTFFSVSTALIAFTFHDI